MFGNIIFTFFLLVCTVSAQYGNETPPTPVTVTNIQQNNCNSGPVQCCNSVMDAKSFSLHPRSSSILRRAGILDILPLNALVGLTCSPLSVIGIGGNSCSSQPVCCENNNFNGLISLGCTPININL